MKRALALVAVLHLTFCGNNPFAYDDATLNDTLSVARLGKRMIRDSTDPGQISVLILDLKVDNHSEMSVDVAFRMTWTLRTRDGGLVGTATERFPRGLAIGASERFQLTIELGSSRLNNLVDAIVFEFE